MRDNDISITFFQTFYYLAFFISVIFVLEDDNLIGLRSVFQSPAMLLQLLMFCLLIILQERIFKVIRYMIPSKARDALFFYKNVEEMIFMEEYEDSKQEFNLQDSTSLMLNLHKQIKTRELVAINQNMLRLHRSDSMDQILERINITAEPSQGTTDNKIMNRSTLINKNLKLHDFNKELEYQNQPADMRTLEPAIYTLYCFSVVLGCSVVLEMSQTEYVSSNKTANVVLLAMMIIMSLGLVLVLKRVKDINHDRLLLFYILLINVLVNIEKSFTINQPRSELVFYAAIACSFLCRLKSFFTVSGLCFVSTVCYFQLAFGNLLYRDELDNL